MAVHHPYCRHALSFVKTMAGRSTGVPAILDGHLILRELGPGRMGTVYLARQLSQNRNAALKVMKPQWASDPAFVARFTRRAYAAAQLTHHNLVHMYDFGEHKGTTYFSMEFVDGNTLADLVREKQRLEVQDAVGYVLQAARGLKCAHEQSMIHGDIKPENLLLNRQGLVKVADLGLVLTPEAAPPEEAAGTRFDARVDIDSLGCTLFVLVTGRSPFEDRTLLESLGKNQTRAIEPPDAAPKGVPKDLAAIILKMTANQPEHRYADLGDVIRALEAFVGVSSTGPFTPREEHAELMEESAKTWNESPAARIRSQVLPAIPGACLGLALLCLLPGWWLAASAFISLGLFITLADFIIVGIKLKTPLFMKVSALVLGSSLSEWLTGIAGVALLVVLLFVLKLFWIWMALGLAAIGIAMGLQVGLGVPTAAERRAPLEQVERMVRSLRLQGVDEDALRQFVCKYSGPHWEELYEALFGYDAKLAARERWGRGEAAKARPRFAVWRDPIVRWIDARLAARRQEKERAVLQKIEEKSLESQGENLVTARRKGERSARAMVATAAEIRDTIRRARDGTIMVNRSIVSAIREAAIKPEQVLVQHERGLIPDRDRERTGIVAKLAGMVLGPKIRFLAGAALLAGSVAWMHRNALISAEHANALVEAAKAGDIGAIQSHAQAGVAHAREHAARPTEVLDLPLVPPELLALVSSFGAGVGGLILIVSSILGGVRIAFFAIPAAAIPVLGPRLGLPTFGGLDPSFITSIVGAGILAAGLLFGRSGR